MLHAEVPRCETKFWPRTTALLRSSFQPRLWRSELKRAPETRINLEEIRGHQVGALWQNGTPRRINTRKVVVKLIAFEEENQRRSWTARGLSKQALKPQDLICLACLSIGRATEALCQSLRGMTAETAYLFCTIVVHCYCWPSVEGF